MKKSLIIALLLAPMSMFAQKFAHFNSADIITIMPEYTQAMSEMQTLQETYEKDLKAMQEEFQTKYESFQKEEATLPENIKQRRMQELQDLDQRLQQSFQENQQALQQAQAEKMQGIQEKLLAAIKKVGDAGGYVYIMDNGSGTIPYINSALSTDVTPEIKKALGI